MNKEKLRAGTVVYHGTDSDEFDEADVPLDGPAWVSSSRSVAEFFARRQGGMGGQRRIISYVLARDLELYAVYSRKDLQRLAEKFELELDSSEDIRQSVRNSGIEGWIIPKNYPDGDDVLISDPGYVLEYQATDDLSDDTDDRLVPKGS